MRAIICGGRSYSFTPKDHEFLNALHEAHKFTLIISGGANGADREGEIWARLNAIPVHVERAQWGLYGKSAGPIRNAAMAELADMVIAFPGGSGTADMVKRAKEKGLAVHQAPT